MGRYKTIIALAVLSLFTFAIYSNVLHGPFIFDDGMYIVENHQIREISLLWPPSPRSLTFLTFAWNYSLGGLDTFGYHLFNVVVHILCSALVFAIALLFFRTRALKDSGAGHYALPFALIAAFLFAAHPVQTQAVSYITQRLASLAALLYLLSVASYLKWRTSGSSARALFYAVALVAAIAAQFAKETGFTLSAVIVLLEYLFFRGEGNSGRRLARLVPFLLVMAVIPLLLFAPGFLGYGSAGISDVTRGQQLKDLVDVSRHDYMATQLRVMATYFRLLVLPIGQNLDYYYPVYKSFLAPEVLFSALLVVSVFVLGLYLLIRGSRAGGPLRLAAGFGILFFFIAMSVESSVIPIFDVIFEHRLYLPSAGAALFFSAMLMGLFDLVKRRSGFAVPPLAWAVIAVMLLAGVLGAAAWSRNNLWADEMLFWRDVVEKSPEKSRVRNNLGNVLYRRGLKAEAIAEFSRAVELDPWKSVYHYNLGNAYKDLWRMEEATKAFEAAVRQDAGNTKARNNLGLSYLNAGRYAEAVAQFEKILETDPRDFKARNNLGLAYSSMGRLDIAEEEFRAALSIKPDFADAQGNLRSVEMKKGE